jgi:RHS repeat-associated protein
MVCGSPCEFRVGSLFRRAPYSYDGNGTRVDPSSPSSATRAACTIGTSNELLYDGTYNYSYDADGNRTARWVATTSKSETAPGPNDTNITIFTWDYRNDLTGETYYSDYANYVGGLSDWSVAYSYDYAGRQIGCYESLTPSDTKATYSVTYTVYDGQNAYLQVSDPYGLTNDLGAGATVSQRYLYGLAVDQILATDDCQDTAASVSWGLGDQEGTIRDVVNNDGESVHVEYDSYGKPINGTCPIAAFSFGFDGMRWDGVTQQYSTETDPYDPSTGTRLHDDDLGFASGTTNFYAWAGDNPLTEVDPTGEQQGYLGGGLASVPGYNQAPIALSTTSPAATTNTGPLSNTSIITGAPFIVNQFADTTRREIAED